MIDNKSAAVEKGVGFPARAEEGNLRRMEVP